MPGSLFRLFAGTSGISPPDACAADACFHLRCCLSHLAVLYDFKALLSSGVRCLTFQLGSSPSCPWPLQGFTRRLHRTPFTSTCRSCPFSPYGVGLQRFIPQSSCVRPHLAMFLNLYPPGCYRPPGISPGSEPSAVSSRFPVRCLNTLQVLLSVPVGFFTSDG